MQHISRDDLVMILDCLIELEEHQEDFPASFEISTLIRKVREDIGEGE